jgi:hypothetical protein
MKFASDKSCEKDLEKYGWYDRVRNDLLHGVKKDRNILHTIKGRKADWVDHILCRNCLPQHVIEVKIDGRVRVT